MNSLQIKNWLVHFKTRLSNKLPLFDDGEFDKQIEFIQELELFVINIEELSKKINVMDERIDEIEEYYAKPRKRKIKQTIAEDEFLETILTKIAILKNIIKQDTGADDNLLSPHLVTVEAIEDEIKRTKRVSKDQLEQLNIIYNKQRIAGKI